MDKTCRLIHVLQKNIKYRWWNWKENQVESVVNRNKVPLLDFLFQDTHDPNTIKLHDILIEIFNFCVPPICRLVPEKVWKCGVWPIELEIRRKWNYENWKSPVMINVSLSLSLYTYTQIYTHTYIWNTENIVPLLEYPSPDFHLQWHWDNQATPVTVII